MRAINCQPMAIDFAATVRQRLKARNLSVRAAALRAGIPVRSLQGYVREGQQPTIDRAASICDALGLEFYIGPHRGKGSRARPLSPMIECAGRVGAHVTRLTDGLEPRGARFSALGCAWFGAGVLTDLELDPERCRAVEVLDSSMAPVLPRASVALADLRRNDPRDGGIYLLGPQTRPSLRRLVRDDRGWRVEADSPGWESRRLAAADEVLGEARWRSLALPPAPAALPVRRRRQPAVNVTAMETGHLHPWAVPWRGALNPGAAVEVMPDLVAWFEVGFLRTLGVDPLRAEVVKVSDSAMEPLFWPGAVVLVDRRRTVRRDGAIYEVATEEGIVLRYLVRARRRWRLSVGTSAIAPPRPWRATDRVLGEAVWSAAFLPGATARTGTSASLNRDS